ncbi:hypothetical protein EV560_10219 [Bosea sp. BK604]|nr:hypothetical protein EV560_10219 [Bosea sp. BK604]
MELAAAAYQIEVVSPVVGHRLVYFVGSDTEETALATLRASKLIAASSEMRIVRSLNRFAIQERARQEGAGPSSVGTHLKSERFKSGHARPKYRHDTGLPLEWGGRPFLSLAPLAQPASPLLRLATAYAFSPHR